MSKKWPITPWVDADGKTKFKVEDDQGYNFSFDSYEDAEDYRKTCDMFVEKMESRKHSLIARFKEELFS